MEDEAYIETWDGFAGRYLDWVQTNFGGVDRWIRTGFVQLGACDDDARSCANRCFKQS